MKKTDEMLAYCLLMKVWNENCPDRCPYYDVGPPESMEILERNTKWVTFEPNDESTWASIRASITTFMMGLFDDGAFQGDMLSNSFYVKCDAEITTQEDQNNGIVNIVVALAPLKPAEFVIIRIQHSIEPT